LRRFIDIQNVDVNYSWNWYHPRVSLIFGWYCQNYSCTVVCPIKWTCHDNISIRLHVKIFYKINFFFSLWVSQNAVKQVEKMSCLNYLSWTVGCMNL
jgi:hypothetical protein